MEGFEDVHGLINNTSPPQLGKNYYLPNSRPQKDIQRERRQRALMDIWCQDNIDDAFKAANQIVTWAVFEYNQGRIPIACDYEIFMGGVTMLSRSLDKRQSFANEMVDRLSACRRDFSYIRVQVYKYIAALTHELQLSHLGVVGNRLGIDEYRKRSAYSSQNYYLNIHGVYVLFDTNIPSTINARLDSFVPPPANPYFDMRSQKTFDRNTGLQCIMPIERPDGSLCGYPTRAEVLNGKYLHITNQSRGKALPNGGHVVTAEQRRITTQGNPNMLAFGPAGTMVTNANPNGYMANLPPLPAQAQQVPQLPQMPQGAMMQQQPSAQMIQVQDPQTGMIYSMTIDQYRQQFHADPPGWQPPLVNLNNFKPYGASQQPQTMQPPMMPQPQMMPPQTVQQPMGMMPYQQPMPMAPQTPWQCANGANLQQMPSMPVGMPMQQAPQLVPYVQNNGLRQCDIDLLNARLTPTVPNQLAGTMTPVSIAQPSDPNKEYLADNKSYYDLLDGKLHLDGVKGIIPVIDNPDEFMLDQYRELASLLVDTGILTPGGDSQFMTDSVTRKSIITWLDRCMTDAGFYKRHDLYDTVMTGIEQGVYDAYAITFPEDPERKRSTLVATNTEEEIKAIEAASLDAVNSDNSITVTTSRPDLDVTIPMTSSSFEELMDEARRMGITDGIYEHYFIHPPVDSHEKEVARITMFRRIVEAKLDNGDDITKPYTGIDYSTNPGVLPCAVVNELEAQGKLTPMQVPTTHAEKGTLHELEVPPVVTNQITCLPEGSPMPTNPVKDNRVGETTKLMTFNDTMMHEINGICDKHFNQLMSDVEVPQLQPVRIAADDEDESPFKVDFSEYDVDDDGHLPSEAMAIQNALDDDGVVHTEPEDLVAEEIESTEDDLEELSQHEVPAHGVTILTQFDQPSHLKNIGTGQIINPNFNPCADYKDDASQDIITLEAPIEPEVRDVADDPESSLSERQTVEVTYDDDDLRSEIQWIEIPVTGKDITEKSFDSFFKTTGKWDAPFTRHEVIATEALELNNYVESMDEALRWVSEYHPDVFFGKNPENPRFATLLTFDEAFVYHANFKTFKECVDKVAEVFEKGKITAETVVKAIEIIESYGEDISGPLSDILTNRFTDAASVTLARKAGVSEQANKGDKKQDNTVIFYYSAYTLQDIVEVCKQSIDGTWSGDVEDYDFALDRCLQYAFGAIWNRKVPAYLDQTRNRDDAQFLMTHRQSSFRVGENGKLSSKDLAFNNAIMGKLFDPVYANSSATEYCDEIEEKLGNIVGIKVERRILVHNLDLPQCDSPTKRKYVTTFANKQFLMQAFKRWGVVETFIISDLSRVADLSVMGYDLDNNVALRVSIAPSN